MCISDWMDKHHILLAIITISAPLLAAACETRWFGSNCQYKCHCSNDSCDGSGECTMGRVCVSGWFGPACQYQDLLSMPGTTTSPSASRITDRDDVTCFTPDVRQLTVTFSGTYPITWIRFNGQLPDFWKNITLVSNEYPGRAQICNKWSRVDDRTSDLFCENDVNVRELVFNGEGVTSLCSLYISGGRNVALKQRATQSSTFSDPLFPEPMAKATNGVDGNTSGQFDDGSCTHTLVNDTAPYWNLTLSSPQRVNRYIIYNRAANMERIIGVQLSSFNNDGNTVFSYTIPNISQAVYSTVSASQNVVFIKIFKTAGNIILTLCEVEIYGDSVCPFYTYGLECTKSCNCENKTETCYVATGGCPSGCAAGFYGDGCHSSCPSLRWGVDCLNQCSIHCANKSCHPTFGTCVYGCVAGYKGPQCNDECSPDMWGAGCLNKCSTNCRLQTCDKTIGKCQLGCVTGYDGDTCQEACPFTKWGENCNKSCSDNCVDQSCNRFSGVCDKSRDDAMTDGNVTQSCSSDDRFGAGIGVGVAITCVVGLVVAVIIFCIFKRRQPRSQPDSPDNSRVNENKHSQSLPMTNYETLNSNSYVSKAYDEPVGTAVKNETSSKDAAETEQSHYYEITDCAYVDPET